MPELVDPRTTNLVAIPSQARPVATPQAQPQQQQQAPTPAPPPNPFRQANGPPILILPHEEVNQQSSQQMSRGRQGLLAEFGPEQFAAASPPGGILVRGIHYPAGQRLPNEADPSKQQPQQAAAPVKKRSLRERLHQVIRSKRQPVRNSRHDIAPLWDAIKANPYDAAGWGIIADALDESDKPHTAALMREMIAGNNHSLTSVFSGVSQYKSFESGGMARMPSGEYDQPRYRGHIVGIPFSVTSLSPIIGYPFRGPVFHAVYIGSHNVPDAVGLHWSIPAKRAQALLSEFDHPEQFSRPVRNAISDADLFSALWPEHVEKPSPGPGFYTPDDIYNGHWNPNGPIRPIESFIAFGPNDVHRAPGHIWHAELSKSGAIEASHPDFYGMTRPELVFNDALVGRTGWIQSVQPQHRDVFHKVVSFWNPRHAAPQIAEFLQAEIDGLHLSPHDWVSTWGHGTMQIKDYLRDHHPTYQPTPVSGPPEGTPEANWQHELEKIGIGVAHVNPDVKELIKEGYVAKKHPWQQAMEDARLLTPGHKWWAPVSEQRDDSPVRFERPIRKRLIDAIVKKNGRHPTKLSRFIGQTHQMMIPAADGPIEYETGNDHQVITRWMVNNLGRIIDNPHLAAIAGWLPGTVMRAFTEMAGRELVIESYDKQTHGSDYSSVRSMALGGSSTIPGYARGDMRSALLLKNDSLGISRDPGNPYRGVSASILARQIIAAHETGIPRITTFASQDPGKKPYFIGGLHWGLMGYDGKLWPHDYVRIPQHIRDQINHATGGQFEKTKSIFDLTSNPEGRQWWVENPLTFDGWIDTHPESRTRKRVMDSLQDSLKKYDSRPAISVHPSPEKMSRAEEHPDAAAYREGLDHLIKTGRVHPDHVDLFVN